ncbi:MAG: inorganic phosphate transporter, partial [Planctomycetota bacterium]
RAVNDTPKVAALVIATSSATGATSWALPTVATAMAAGGLLGARKVAETMSKRIAGMNAGQGATGNLVTAALVIAASRYGLPVSTTHVSCGAIMGIGTVTRQVDFRVARNILLAWLTTLPLGAVLGALLFWSLS